VGSFLGSVLQRLTSPVVTDSWELSLVGCCWCCTTSALKNAGSFVRICTDSDGKQLLSYAAPWQPPYCPPPAGHGSVHSTAAAAATAAAASAPDVVFVGGVDDK
jgi:hypothetical protein